VITGPGEESGTYASFVELALEDIAEEREQEAETRPDYQASPDDNVIIQGIQGTDTSFGWVGFAFARDAEGVKVLEVDGGDGCVGPTDETIADNTYPLSRPLFIYVNKAKAEENETLATFVDFYLNDSISSVSDVGYALNPLQVRGQDEGAAVMGVGHALMEHLILDEDGHTRNLGALDYRIPTGKDLPLQLETQTVEHRDGPGPYGAKGLSEGSLLCTAPAIAAAVTDATGAVIRELPLTPERVWRAIRDVGIAR
jgi:hypothetical protein